MITGEVDWVYSEYFYRNEDGMWRFKPDTPSELIKQFNSFMLMVKYLYS